MVTVLYPDTCCELANAIVRDLNEAYAGHLELALVPASSPAHIITEPSWDDLLIVPFDSQSFPAEGRQFIKDYIAASSEPRLVLPVAVESHCLPPPEPISGIKALNYDTTAAGANGRLARRVGAMLGLRVQRREKSIFISYRSIDGAAIANQLYCHLQTLGYVPWRDEAREFDGEPKILPGSPVQKEIDDSLSKANLVLLVDTPLAPQSVWIKHEIETANGLLLPILPVCFRANDDKKQGPRFRSLLDLQRWVSLESPAPDQELPLSAGQLDQIVSEMEGYLSEIFRRKCRVPFLVEKEFASRQFSWRVLDQRFLMFESTKQISWRVPIKVLSHCSVFEHVHLPALKKLAEFLSKTPKVNHTLYIYDGELIPELELKEIIENMQDSPALVLHHQELATLIDSNFTTLAA